ncbi:MULTISPECIES: NB-ARC domain-containing protein [unclassified Microcoleus]|uniref:NB-ARC domain-containing protein n=1 Tax=unclassified Microcoleus TaxID=2642155 RepID=UPI001DAF25F5|nr:MULTISPECIES: NB-ARC domain-containing protein [unclassified Microcoleus]TAF90539.1 MAG: NACHT domain-containing protein [Oscillatoriales cyanobacterium]MCC3411034.1 NACHT domain-containing protein [Microcoleus sp. PH2017_02_FOX_O_A]MCC3447696.1 NACHT domain-containing protein [Microcoleus sp. PH2017_09_SFU_O_A]MCC3514962.1 NACHT domain-containing protein [Microcoleus sp. PH2017_18_LLB_O_A]MCC3628629.1 NACHT domain-containing protein [Microcoleus sp. PH2017_39_LGB_O_B]
MNVPKARRDRGRILTDKGWKKIWDAIYLKFTDRPSLQTISEQTDPGLNRNSPSFVSTDTVSNILNRRAPADTAKMESLFASFGLRLESDDRTSGDISGNLAPAPTPQTRQNCSELPDISGFFGRREELGFLKNWISGDRCRLVAIFGMGGIGKTALCAQLAKQIQNEFEFVIWRSLSNQPSCQDLAIGLIQFICDCQGKKLPENLSDGISVLIEYLQAHRCLIVLDGVETILDTGGFAGKYRSGYEDYERLFRQIGESNHQSCLLLTSSEKSRDIAMLEGQTRPVRSYKLTGLDNMAAREILQERGLTQEKQWDELIDCYAAHPLALRIVSAMILELFNGKSSEFIRENTVFLGQINHILSQQFQRLSVLEKDVIKQLATAGAPMDLAQLRGGLSEPVKTSNLMEALESLGWRSLIEKITVSGNVAFTLQPVVRKYAIER